MKVCLQERVIRTGECGLVYQPVCHTLSNAWATSRKTAVHSCCTSRPLAITWKIAFGEW
jgi:hypothetical protein